ncbi:MAG: hypothetical protein M1818_000769 [Claussenomyces sp. TS43310]|nr:MAG: hypothetical protein M1818_000769 [Claussenomyces sp. TS43310]
MSRMGSRGSNLSARQTVPFTSNGRMPPPLHASNLRHRPSITTTESWQSQRDDPFNTFSRSSQHHGRTPGREASRGGSDLQQVAEDSIGFGEDPAEYLARINAPSLSFTQPSVDINGGLDPLRIPLHRESIPSPLSQSFTPSSASSATLTNGTTLASDMSRQSSMCNDAIGSLQMFKFNSNNSFLSDTNSSDDSFYLANPLHGPDYSKLLEEQSLLLAGAGGDMDPNHFSAPHQPPAKPVFSNWHTTTDMKRSVSNDSDASTSSTQSRAKLQLQKQNQLAAVRPLMPKAGSEEDNLYRNVSLHASPHAKSTESNDAKPIPISKSSTYVRPKHERVFCDRCPDLVEGFRGPHELGRHQDRVHKELVKKWVCVEPAEGSNTSGIRPINPLSKCKTCSQQKKKYGAYYNAAAHLRRAHFRPKPRGRGKSSKADEKTEKRGGKGGGFWPPMNELKHWMREVYDENRLDDDQQQEEDASEEEDDYVDGSFQGDTSPSMPINANVASTTYADFDDGMLFADSSMLDAYPTPASSYNDNTQGMQMMQQQVQVPPQQSAVNGGMSMLPMRFEAGQMGMFDSPCALMDADLSFMDPSFSQLDDQYGPEFFNHLSYTTS